ncbi:MAG: M20/M25/M40 family metallo-hydrolase [Patescibacteria group bacterium]
MEKTLELTKKLISIKSFVDSSCNEIGIADFVVGYCSKVPNWQVTKQPILNGRYNILISDGYPTRLLYLGHLDTVQPKFLQNRLNTRSFISREKLYGLGTADMKGNIAAFLTAWEKIGKTKGIAALLYIDEEYDFAGMKAFIREYKSKISPQLILSGDGNDLTLGNGCRGLIELTVRVKGKTGHASNPLSGVNAITRSYAVIRRLQKYFQKFCRSQELGRSTINLAYMQGGLLQKKSSSELILGKQGNNIPDFAEFVLDIRPSIPTLNAERVSSLLKGFIADEGLTLDSITTRHDLGAWITPKEQLNNVARVISTETLLSWTDSGKRGFIDVQLLAQALPNTPCCTFGAGDGTTVHREDENIPLYQLPVLENIYKKIILELKGGEQK